MNFPSGQEQLIETTSSFLLAGIISGVSFLQERSRLTRGFPRTRAWHGAAPRRAPSPVLSNPEQWSSQLDMAADPKPDWLSCLPSTWSYGVTRDGRIFFIK